MRSRKINFISVQIFLDVWNLSKIYHLLKEAEKYARLDKKESISN